MKKTSTKELRKLQLMKRHAEREYKKGFATHHHQLNMMKDVVSALKRGDVKALDRAEAALKASMKALQSKTGNFLHLLQLGHRLAERDCPYCAAQCIGKCHDGGNPYAQCMVQCADAGQ